MCSSSSEARRQILGGGVRIDGKKITDPNLVFYTPGNQFLTHGGMAKSWPFDPLNRDLSHYNQNNFGPSKSYHVVGEYNDFFGGYYKDSDTGFGHLTVAPRHWKVAAWAFWMDFSCKHNPLQSCIVSLILLKNCFIRQCSEHSSWPIYRNWNNLVCTSQITLKERSNARSN